MSPAGRNKSGARPQPVTGAMIKRWALPKIAEDADKEARGRVLVIGGSPSLMGAPILAATAALRGGAGKLQIAVPQMIALHVGAAVPEAMVIGLSTMRDGTLSAAGIRKIARQISMCHAVLIGPGLTGGQRVSAVVRAVLDELDDQTTLVMDAEALHCLRDAPDLLHRLRKPAILTPHLGEMAGLTGKSKPSLKRDGARSARELATRTRTVVALKGAETFIAEPNGKTYLNTTGNVGLATSGSGDCLAGLITGLAARGASPAQAAVWGTYLHGRAAEVLGRELGGLGFLARELPPIIPQLLARHL